MSHRKEFLLREKKKTQNEKEKQKQTNKQTNKTQGTGGVAQIVDT
jgi:hypothetical protein